MHEKRCLCDHGTTRRKDEEFLLTHNNGTVYAARQSQLNALWMGFCVNYVWIGFVLVLVFSSLFESSLSSLWLAEWINNWIASFMHYCNMWTWDSCACRLASSCCSRRLERPHYTVQGKTIRFNNKRKVDKRRKNSQLNHPRVDLFVSCCSTWRCLLASCFLFLSNFWIKVRSTFCEALWRLFAQWAFDDRSRIMLRVFLNIKEKALRWCLRLMFESNVY